MESDLMSEGSQEKRFRTLFISDVHLGARGSQTDRLLDFLRHHDADTIYLVGDIIDGWALKSNWHWPAVPQRFRAEDAPQGAQRRPRHLRAGNHDEFLRSYYGTHAGGIEVIEQTIHEGGRRPALSGDPRRYL